MKKKLLGNWNGTPPYMYHRYLDDFFFVWTSTVVELEFFLHHINQEQPDIKFTAIYDQETKTIPFLDNEQQN